MDYANSRLADALAAQYVAGTLRGRARRRFDALLPSHPALQQALRNWQGRLLPLTAALAPEAPPPRVWQAIERRLWPAAPAAVRPAGWWQRLGLWQGLAGTASAAALALAVLVQSPPPAVPPVVVVLQGTGADNAFGGTIVASLAGDGRALVTRPLTPVSLAAERVLELWSVPPEGAPRSLCLISASGVTVLARERLPATLLKGGTAALAVSVEPPGGSPTGAPTGPVVFAGKLQM
jgi:anti-sigma-K factor RskA